MRRSTRSTRSTLDVGTRDARLARLDATRSTGRATRLDWRAKRQRHGAGRIHATL